MSSSKRARTESYSPSLGSELLQFDNAHATSVLKTLYTQSKTGCGTDFTVWCGAERCRFDMHSAVIAATSAYFCTLIGGSWATRQAVLGQIAPRIFEQIAESLYTGRLRNVEEETYYFGFTWMDGLLYMVGGRVHGHEACRAVECYNPMTRAWRALPELCVARSNCGVAVIDGKLYVVGGLNLAEDYSSMKSAEVFDPLTGQWQVLPDMRVRRNESGVASIDGKLYVVGGYVGKSGEVFDPSTREWQALPDMSVPRSACSATSMDGKLYVVGGRQGTGTLKSVEVLDPSTMQWQSLPDMSVERENCGVAFIEP